MSWNLIPQLFYDLLARLIPGAAVVLVSVPAFLGPQKSMLLARSEAAWVFGPGPALVFLLVAYLAGLTFGELWESTFGLLRNRMERRLENDYKTGCIREHNRAQKLRHLPELQVDAGDLPREFVMHDHLRQAAPVESSRLMKVRAERRLCHVLIVGFATACVVNAVFSVRERTMERLILEVTLLLVVVMSWRRAVRLHKYLVTGICVWWLSNVGSGSALSEPSGDDVAV